MQCPVENCGSPDSFERFLPAKNFDACSYVTVIENMEYSAGMKMKKVYKDYVLDLTEQWRIYRRKIDSLTKDLAERDSRILSLEQKIRVMETRNTAAASQAAKRKHPSFAASPADSKSSCEYEF